ncbi:MAG TPA: hypothetical protein VFN39_09245 [Gemmatimonadaceae bacterium]|nr:hypothetical protein [Gemmatimonadaceae bacterium]
MKPAPILRILGAAALLTVAARTAAAQSGPSSASAAAAPVTHWAQHPLGRYRLELALPDRKMQADLTISDSAGTPVANFWPVGDNDGHMLMVAVKDTDLVLSAQTPRGPFSLVLQRQGNTLSGRYAMGMQESGAVTGTVTEEAKQP